jgi:hypothetical protein
MVKCDFYLAYIEKPSTDGLDRVFLSTQFHLTSEIGTHDRFFYDIFLRMLYGCMVVDRKIQDFFENVTALLSIKHI